MQVREVITLPTFFSGREVIETVKSIAADAYCYEPVRASGGMEDQVVGQKSEHAYENVAVFACFEWNNAFPLKGNLMYNKLVVTSHEWSGVDYSAGYDIGDAALAVQVFCDRLREHLARPSSGGDRFQLHGH